MEMNPGELPVPAGCWNMNFLVPRSFMAMAAEIRIGSGKSGSMARVFETEGKYRPKEGARGGPRAPSVLVALATPWPR